MAKKDPGFLYYNCLCVLHLYEMEVNLLMSIFCQKLDYSCEGEQLLHQGVYGNEHRCCCHNPVLIDIIQTEFSLVTRTALVTFNLDMTTCFDCILPHI